MTASNTLECSVLTRFLAIGWLWPKINTVQDIVIYIYVHVQATVQAATNLPPGLHPTVS